MGINGESPLEASIMLWLCERLVPAIILNGKSREKGWYGFAKCCTTLSISSPTRLSPDNFQD